MFRLFLQVFMVIPSASIIEKIKEITPLDFDSTTNKSQYRDTKYNVESPFLRSITILPTSFCVPFTKKIRYF